MRWHRGVTKETNELRLQQGPGPACVKEEYSGQDVEETEGDETQSRGARDEAAGVFQER